MRRESAAPSLGMPWAKDEPSEAPAQLAQEWLTVNGLGGYAAGTVAGACTRRFHGLLIAALPSPLGRVMMLNHLSEELRLPDGSLVLLGGEEVSDGGLSLHGLKALAGFRLEHGLPVWRYDVRGFSLEKSLVMPHLQNTVFVRYRLLEGKGRVRIHMRPSVRFRPHQGPVDEPLPAPYRVRSYGDHHEIVGSPDLPPLRLRVHGEGAAFVLEGGTFREIFYRLEHSRGYDARGPLWNPGYMRAELVAGGSAGFAASTEAWGDFSALGPDDAFDIERLRRRNLLLRAKAGPDRPPELVLAADKFIITPNTRVLHAARVRAEGDDVRSIIAGYHWFTDWGRDTMISLEGLALLTGRAREAGCILRMFARHLSGGLIPNLFPEGGQEGLYHTADATLWFFHALDRYLEHSNDRGTLKLLLPKLEEVIARHAEGTRFGIGVDPSDGLLRQGEEGYQLTWMDAKVGDWVVTPRRGKPVEINALWYNALRLMERWAREELGEEAARPHRERAERARESFNRRFWNAEAGCLYDVLDGDPRERALVRPNQIFAVSLPNPVLDPRRWEAVVETVRRELLTPVGLRSLAPGSPQYRARYDGDLRSRDAAYHQGTVWAWLIGPFVDAWLKVRPEDRAGARGFLGAFMAHLERQACLGSVSEIFDAEEPYTPRGCVAQAWSVAELLRAWVKTAG